MPLPEPIRKSWEEIQKKHDFPVNALGVKIATNDEKTLKVWQEEGIDSFVKR